MASFADVQYFIYADKVGGWVGRVQKRKKYADVIKKWSLRLTLNVKTWWRAN